MVSRRVTVPAVPRTTVSDSKRPRQCAIVASMGGKATRRSRPHEWIVKDTSFRGIDGEVFALTVLRGMLAQRPLWRWTRIGLPIFAGLGVLCVATVLAGCGSSTALAGGDGGSGAPGYAQTNTCKLLSAHLAASVLGGPTRIDPTQTGRTNGASNCFRELIGSESNSVSYGRSTWKALKPAASKAGFHSISKFMKHIRRAAAASCKNI